MRLKAGRCLPEREGCQRRNGIHPAGAQENKPGTPCLAKLKQVYRTIEVLLDKVAATGTVHPSKHAWVGGAVKDPIHFWQRGEEPAIANVSDPYINSECFERLYVRLAAFSTEVIEAYEGELLVLFNQRASYRGPCKSADAGNKNIQLVGRWESAEKPAGLGMFISNASEMQLFALKEFRMQSEDFQR